MMLCFFFFFSSRRRHTRFDCDWSSDVCSSDLFLPLKAWSKARLVVTLHNYSLTCAKVIYMHNDAPCSGPGVVKCLSCATKHYGLVRGTPTVLSNWLMELPGRSSVDMFLAVSQAVADGNKLERN